MVNEKVAKALVDANVVKFGDFTLVSGIKTPVYFDLRVLPSYPESFQAVTDELVKLVQKLKIDVVAGAETAGIPIAAAISLKSKIPMIYVRKKPKDYATRKMIEGVFEKGAKVVLIDDMATNGLSKIRFIAGIKHSDGLIKDVVIILDREQGATETLSKEHVKLHYLITFSELLNYMKDKNIVSEEDYDKTMEYLEKSNRKV